MSLERIYTNREPGRERIHIGIPADEIHNLLHGLHVGPGTHPATTQLKHVLMLAAADFAGGLPQPVEVGEIDWLQDRIASAARTVRLRLGPNALATAQRGEAVYISGSEAEDIAREVLDVVRPFMCGASAEGVLGGFLGPCVLSPIHEGPVHLGPDGERWLCRDAIPRTGREVLHQTPPRGSGVLPCCGLIPAELPRTDLLTYNPAAVTCTRRAGTEGTAP